MAYVVNDEILMRTVSTQTNPWNGNYTSWYSQGKHAFSEPTRREDAGGIGPCRVFLSGPFETSGNYRVPSPVSSPLPFVIG